MKETIYLNIVSTVLTSSVCLPTCILCVIYSTNSEQNTIYNVYQRHRQVHYNGDTRRQKFSMTKATKHAMTHLDANHSLPVFDEDTLLAYNLTTSLLLAIIVVISPVFILAKWKIKTDASSIETHLMISSYLMAVIVLPMEIVKANHAGIFRNVILCVVHQTTKLALLSTVTSHDAICTILFCLYQVFPLRGSAILTERRKYCLIYIPWLMPVIVFSLGTTIYYVTHATWTSRLDQCSISTLSREIILLFIFGFLFFAHIVVNITGVFIIHKMRKYSNRVVAVVTGPHDAPQRRQRSRRVGLSLIILIKTMNIASSALPIFVCLFYVFGDLYVSEAYDVTWTTVVFTTAPILSLMQAILHNGTRQRAADIASRKWITYR